MFSSAGRRVRSVVLLALAAALTVAGVAAAEQGEGSQSSSKGTHSGAPGPQGAPPLGLPAGTTYAQVHVDHNGQTQVISLEEGKIVSVDSSSITVRESDGTEATIPVNEDTKVLGKPGAETSVSDLKTGQLVVVCGPEGATAKSIMVVPAQGSGGPQGPPPTGEGQPQAGPLMRSKQSKR